MKALVFYTFGGPEVLSVRDVPDPEPLEGHAIVGTAAIGLNFADVYRRRGTYHLAGSPPYIAGYEAAGVVESIADGAPEGLVAGARVAFADCPFANAEKVRVPFEKLIALPDDVSFETAAAVLLQGLTAQYLVRDSHPLRAGETAVVHAAAGGVGLLLLQIASRLGARAIGLVSTEKKRAAALEAGARHVFLTGEDWKARVLDATDGRGADVVYDSVGATLLDSFAAARTGGRVVFFGAAGGKPPLVDPAMLMDTSKTLTGGDLWNVLTSRGERLSRAGELFGWLRDGSLRVRLARRFPLHEGATAHAYLEGRGSIGKVLLIPDSAPCTAWEAYARSDYTVDRTGQEEAPVIRVGAPNELLDRLLDAHGVREWAYVTAYNPHSSSTPSPKKTREENEAAQRALEAELGDRHPFLRGHGVGWAGDHEPEPSLLVLGIAREEAERLGRAFAQDAILFGTHGGAAELVDLR